MIIMRTIHTALCPRVSTIEEKIHVVLIKLLYLCWISLSSDKLSYIYNTLIVKSQDTDDKKINVTFDVHQLLENNRVKAIAMGATHKFMRGIEGF
jgi:F-type H+/Na+-transporting ATPase subunit beta